jgi:hypothetical protein
MRAAWKVTTPEEREKRLEQLARFLERDYESAPRSLREGMAEMFTLQRLKLPPSLYKWLATTNLIESPQSGVARRTANVKYGVIREWSGVGLPRPGYSPKTVSEKSPAIVTCGRSPRFSDAKPRLKSRRRK